MTTLPSHGLAPTREVLSNGAAIVVKESTTTPAVTLNVSVQAGSIHDPEHAVGSSYFLSRVIDRGTARRSADAIAEDLDGRGVALGATVTRHAMTFVCTCLTEDFEGVLDLVADVVRGATCPEEEVVKRRGEIITAIRQDEDNPAVRAVEELMGVLYGSTHPYGRRTKGDVRSVEHIGRSALLDFHRARIAPSALSLVVVGDVEPPAAVAAASRAFGDWRNEAAEASQLPPVPLSRDRRCIVLPMMNKAQADIAYGFTTIARSDPAYYAYWVMNNILGQYGLGGRLGHKIRERQGMAYYAFSGLDANVAAGPLVVRAGVSPSNVDRAVRSIDEEIETMASEGVTDDELADSKRYLIGSIPRMLETNAGIAAFLQTTQLFDLGLDYDRRLPELLGTVTRNQVCQAAQRTLSPERAAIVIAGPYGSAGADDSARPPAEASVGQTGAGPRT